MLLDLQELNNLLSFSLPFWAWGAVRRHVGAAGMEEKEDLAGRKRRPVCNRLYTSVRFEAYGMAYKTFRE